MASDRHLDAMEVARYVVSKCATDEVPVSNLQLQKILYFLQYVYCTATEAHQEHHGVGLQWTCD